MGTGSTQHRADNSRRRRSTAWPQQAPRATAVSPRATRLGHRAELRGKAGATVSDASRTSDQDGPKPGVRAGPAAPAGGRAHGTGAPARSAVIREGALNRMAEGESRRRPECAMRAVRKEVSTGTIRRSVDQEVVRARALARRRVAPLS